MSDDWITEVLVTALVFMLGVAAAYFGAVMAGCG